MASKSQRRIRIGDSAPAFTLKSQNDEVVRLSDFVGKSCLVLYFYPKDFSPGCTAEAAAFRDSYRILAEAGAEIIGVSSDTVGSHKRFAEEQSLPFILLSDVDGKVRELYGVKSTLGLISGRVTYIIDTDGVIRHIFSSQIRPKKHVKEALEALEKLKCFSQD